MIHKLYSKYDKISKNFIELLDESCPSCKKPQSLFFNISDHESHCNKLPQSIKSHILSNINSDYSDGRINVSSIKNSTNSDYIINDKFILNTSYSEITVLNPTDDEKNLNLHIISYYFECNCNDLIKRSYIQIGLYKIYYLEAYIDKYVIAYNPFEEEITNVYQNGNLIHSIPMHINAFLQLFSFNQNILDGLRNYLLLL